MVNATLNDDGRVTDFRVRSEAGQNVTVLSASKLGIVDARTGAVVPVRRVTSPIHAPADDQLWEFMTVAGGEYELTIANRP